MFYAKTINMKKFYLLALAALMPLVGSAKPEQAREGIVIMSYNIRNGDSKDGTNSWEYRYPASAMMLDDTKPDVVGLQEALDKQVTYLKTVFDRTYKIVGVGREDGKKAGEMTAILYNYKTVSLLKWGTFWLSETPDTPSTGWDASCPRTATWAIFKDKGSGKKFFFINTHIDRQGTEARKKGVRILADKILELNVESLPVVITGDFNLETGDPALAPLSLTFQNARESSVVTDDHFSYNGWGKIKETVDHIWYKGVTSTKFETLTKAYDKRTFISDHFPVKATLIFP